MGNEPEQVDNGVAMQIRVLRYSIMGNKIPAKIRVELSQVGGNIFIENKALFPRNSRFLGMCW